MEKDDKYEKKNNFCLKWKFEKEIQHEDFFAKRKSVAREEKLFFQFFLLIIHNLRLKIEISLCYEIQLLKNMVKITKNIQWLFINLLIKFYISILPNDRLCVVQKMEKQGLSAILTFLSWHVLAIGLEPILD